MHLHHQRRAGVETWWLGLLVAAMVPATTLADTLRVPEDHPTIQAAIDAAADGHTVLVAPGEYIITEPIDFNRLHDPVTPGAHL